MAQMPVMLGIRTTPRADPSGPRRGRCEDRPADRTGSRTSNNSVDRGHDGLLHGAHRSEEPVEIVDPACALASSSASIDAVSAKSWPAQNASPAPVSTIARQLSSALAWSIPSMRDWRIADVQAFSLSGRLSVMTVTGRVLGQNHCRQEISSR